MEDWRQRSRRGQIWGGMFLLLVGALVLMRQLSFGFLPYWLFSWPMILIGLGLFIGIRHSFQGGGWLVMIIIGGIFLLDDIFPDFNANRFIAPIIIISIGLLLILRPRRSRLCAGQPRFADRWNDKKKMSGFESAPGPEPAPEEANGPSSAGSASFDDYIDSVAVFGGNHRVILSKNFKGGEATSVMGGTELDLSQADIQGTVVLDLTQVLGGAKLIVPAHWHIKNQINAVLGGVDDKRQVRTASVDPNKVLVLKGVCFLGGLEIRNY